jgi:hypothetical protein
MLQRKPALSVASITEIFWLRHGVLSLDSSNTTPAIRFIMCNVIMLREYAFAQYKRKRPIQLRTERHMFKREQSLRETVYWRTLYYQLKKLYPQELVRRS